MANQLSKSGETLLSSQVLEKILRSLTEKFENVVCAIEESKDLSMFTIEELIESLEVHEQRKRKVESLQHALQSKVTIKEEKAHYTQNI